MYDVDFDQDELNYLYDVDEDDYEYLQSIYLARHLNATGEVEGWEDDEDGWDDEEWVWQEEF